MTNSSDERSPRFTKAIFGRILAVLAFVALGTFAVVQSVMGVKQDVPTVVKPNEDSVASLDPGANTDGTGESTNSPSAKLNPTDLRAKVPTKKVSFGKSPSLGPNTSGNSSSGSSFNAPKPTSFDPSQFGKPAPKPFPETAKTPAAKVTTNKDSFASTRRPFTNTQTPEKKQPPASQAPSLRPTKPIVVAKQATPPSTFSPIGGRPPATQGPLTNPARPAPRVAQVGDNTFNGRPSTSSTLRDTATNAAQATSEFAQNLRNSASQTTNNALQATKNGFDSLADSTRNAVGDTASALRSNFNSPPPTNPTARSTSPTRSTSPGPIVTSSQPSTFNSSSRSTSNLGSGQLRAQSESTTPPSSVAPIRRSFGSTPPSNNNSLTRPVSAPSSPPARQRFTPMGNTPVNNSSTLGSSRALGGSNPVSINAKTSSTPGDRRLEGMQAPALTIEKIAPREIQVNQPADFQIVVRNSGRVTANDVQVFDMIPKGTEYVSAAPQPSRSGAADLRWSLGEMHPGQEKRIRYQLKPTQPGEIGSVAHVTFASQASMRTRVTKPMLEIRHSAQPKVLIGDNVVFDIIVENKGDGPANDVMIAEDVPPQLEFSDGTRELEYPIGTLGPGQSRKLKLALKAAEIGRLKNVLMASAAGNLRAQHAIDMEVIAPQLYASGNGPKRKFLKREATHQFSIENRGTADATNVELIARLPSGLKYVSANNRGKYDPNTHAVYWSLAELTPSVVGSVELKTLPIEAGEQEINFEAFADLDQKSKVTQNLVVEHLIDVFFDIDDVADPIEIGSGTSYRLRVENQGTKTATNIRLQVEFPSGIQPISVDGNLPNEIRGQTIVFAPITSMNPGDELSLVVNGRGVSPGDHRVAVRLQTDGRTTPVMKEETTRVYNDQ